MATVTSLTADRMLAIEAASVVDGAVVGDNLILEKHDGTTINAGNVRGPVGADASTFITFKPAADLPSTYPLGITTMTSGAASAAGYPCNLATVFTYIQDVSRGYQVITEKASGTTNPPQMWIRVVGQDLWGAFQKLATIDSAGLLSVPRVFISSETDVSTTSTLPPFQIGDDAGANVVMDGNEIIARNNGEPAVLYIENGANTNTTPTADSHLTRKDYVDQFGLGTELGNAINLNSIIVPGIYTQSNSSEAAAGTNYPEAQAGLLEVRANALSAPSMVWQRYTPYGQYGNRYWVRSYYSLYTGSPPQWSAWTLMDGYDSGWVTLTITNTTNFALWVASEAIQIRRIGKSVQLRGAVKANVAGIVDSSTETSANLMFPIPAAYLPAVHTPHHVFVCQGSGLNRWQLRISNSGAYAGRYGPSASAAGNWLPFNVSWFID